MADTEIDAAVLEPAEWPAVAEYARALEADGAGSPLVTAIHPEDEMFRYELSLAGRGNEGAAVGYFSTGSAIAGTVLEALRWRFGDPRAARLLDFASGRGRTTRFLVRRIPASRITVAEIDAASVGFQRRTFGVAGVVSTSDPEDLRLDGAFDAVLACSFFSHLPAGRFERWLARLYELVAPGGMLFFSVHGMRLLEEAERRAAGDAGIVFRAASENSRLNTAEYGTSFVSEEFVSAAAARAAAGARLLRFPYGLCGYQDLCVLLRPPLPAGPGLLLPRHPLGALVTSSVEAGRVRLEGWTEGDADEHAPDVRLLFRNEVAQTSPRGEVDGTRREWRFDFSVEAVGPDDLVRVEAVSERGLVRILVMGTLRPYLPSPDARA